jgi:hypothetical protein
MCWHSSIARCCKGIPGMAVYKVQPHNVDAALVAASTAHGALEQLQLEGLLESPRDRSLLQRRPDAEGKQAHHLLEDGMAKDGRQVVLDALEHG